MTEDRSPKPGGNGDNRQSLAKIQHSKAHRGEEDETPDRATVVADPRNRLEHGKIDPATHEKKPAK